MEKKLYKDKENKKIAGVCSGFAEYFGINVVWVRLVWALLFVAYGVGLIAYIVCAIVMPDKEKAVTEDNNPENVQYTEADRCESCGAVLNTTDKFCPKCGKKVSEDEAE